MQTEVRAGVVTRSDCIVVAGASSPVPTAMQEPPHMFLQGRAKPSTGCRSTLRDEQPQGRGWNHARQWTIPYVVVRCRRCLRSTATGPWRCETRPRRLVHLW